MYSQGAATIMDFLALGSSVSIRGMQARFSGAMSVNSFMFMGSSLSLRSFTRCASAISVTSGAFGGLRFSITGSIKLASTLSLRSCARISGKASILDSVTLGSSLSLRSSARFTSNTSVLGMLNLGSSFSIRNFGRCSSGLSIVGGSYVGSCSVLNQLDLGSTLSVRSFARFGMHTSVLDTFCLGSTFSMRSFARCGSSLSVNGNVRIGCQLEFGPSTGGGAPLNYIKYSNAAVSGYNTAYAFYATDGSAAARRMSFGNGSNTNRLHGTWESDGTISVTSDRRLKKNIRPLYEGLLDEHARVNFKNSESSSDKLKPLESGPKNWEIDPATGIIGEEPLASKMFRKLRPVAFSLKTDIESKRTSFGFIAQELQQLYPSIVTESEDRLSVHYTDLIAVITLTVQQEMSRLDIVHNILEKVEGVAEQHNVVLRDSETKIRTLEIDLLRLKNSYNERAQKLVPISEE